MKASKVVCLWLVVLGCSGLPDETSTTRAPLTRENGLTTNALYENGNWSNGNWSNGNWSNGNWSNGNWSNGNWSNGNWSNGNWSNGLFSNGNWSNGVVADEFRANPYTGQLLKYLYSCAMPAMNADGLSLTTVIGPAGAEVVLEGSVGLGINRDDTTWWETGKCDEGCQRWVSACVLARTNAYGVNVNISMRAPANAPAKVQAALALVGNEADEFPLPEGAFYGNIFQTTPQNQPPTPDYTGATDGPILMTPAYFACAGPGSNIPEVTKRFCSSQGDNSVIKVTGVCRPTDSEPEGACLSTDGAGNMQACRAGGAAYSEVITVYLHDLIAKCGNAVCESTENVDSCPSDCHPGAWAKRFDTTISNGYANNIATFDPARLSSIGADGSIVVVGNTQFDVDLGSGLLPKASYENDLVIAKYDASGVGLWSRRVASINVRAMTTAGDGTTIVLGSPWNLWSILWVSKYDAAGNVLAGWPKTFDIGSLPLVFAMTADAAGNVLIGGNYTGTVTFGDHSITSASSAGWLDGFVAKLDTAGTFAWATTLPTTVGSNNLVGGVAADPAGNALAVVNGGSIDGLYRLDATTGAIDPAITRQWASPTVYPIGVAADAQGAIYITGWRQSADLGGGMRYANGPSFFLAKYDASGNYKWDTTCMDNAPCAGAGHRLSFDNAGNIVVSGLFGPGRVNFGVGAFDAYRMTDTFVAAYTTADAPPTRRLRWAKHLPTVLDGNLFGLEVNAQAGRIGTAGVFSGSMSIDDQLLVSKKPVDPFYFDTFVGSFKLPPANDTAPPFIFDVPLSRTTQATSAAGAQVYFMPPTAKDDGAAGTNVSCSPSSFTTLPIGTTTITCTASDPWGNTSQASFTVTVVDTHPPLLMAPPSNLTVDATSAAGAAVAFTPPTALDQVDGPRPVTCTAAPGSTFAIGATTVVCSATDTRGNTNQTSFVVTVNPWASPPLIAFVPPVIEAVAANSPVTYMIVATDANGQALVVTCDPPSGSVFPVGTTIVECSATDSTGQSTTVSFPVTVVDLTPPVIIAPISTNATANSAGGMAVTYSTSAIDSVNGTVAVTCTPPSGSTFALGTTTVTCVAEDAQGNTSTSTFQVAVTLAWSGILQPINIDGTSIFKINSNVPVKFQLTGASSTITNAVAHLTLVKLSSSVSGTVLEAVATGSADTGNVFRYDATSNQYMFNLATRDLTPGTYRLGIDLHDGVQRHVDISLKK